MPSEFSNSIPEPAMDEPIPELDCLIVGAGFGAYAMLNKLRKQEPKLNVKIYERGSGSGGIWHWNCYPGARVDTDMPIYQMFDKELWSTFTYKERFPGWQEIRRYFDHVDKVWDVKKDICYYKEVDTATFDEERHQWLIECSDGSLTYCRWFIPALGFASRRYTPPIKGLSEFRGDVYHTGAWPQHGANLKNKRIAQVGTGASGIQVIQAIGPQTKQMTIYQRTPNQCLRMIQEKLDPAKEEKKKQDGWYQAEFDKTWETFSGFTYGFTERNTFDDTPEEREKFYYQQYYVNGGFNFWLGNYKDALFNKEANEEAYKFWRKEVLKRIPDPKKAALLAPEHPVHPWGTRRSSLETHFYEVVSLPHIDIIDVNENPIEEVTPTGIRTKLGHVEFDVIILATGFDTNTGGLTQLDIRGTDGNDIQTHWKDGVKTSMGIAIPGFPNMFIMYGPQAPTGFANGPSCAQQQAWWIDSTIKTLNDEGITRIEAKEEPAIEWGERCRFEWNKSLFPLAKSWWTGANIPGKKVDAYNWAGGLVPYREQLKKSLENNYQDWTISRKGATVKNTAAHAVDVMESVKANGITSQAHDANGVISAPNEPEDMITAKANGTAVQSVEVSG